MSSRRHICTYKESYVGMTDSKPSIDDLKKFLSTKKLDFRIEVIDSSKPHFQGYLLRHAPEFDPPNPPPPVSEDSESRDGHLKEQDEAEAEEDPSVTALLMLPKSSLADGSSNAQIYSSRALLLEHPTELHTFDLIWLSLPSPERVVTIVEKGTIIVNEVPPIADGEISSSLERDAFIVTYTAPEVIREIFDINTMKAFCSVSAENPNPPSCLSSYVHNLSRASNKFLLGRDKGHESVVDQLFYLTPSGVSTATDSQTDSPHLLRFPRRYRTAGTLVNLSLRTDFVSSRYSRSAYTFRRFDRRPDAERRGALLNGRTPDHVFGLEVKG